MVPGGSRSHVLRARRACTARANHCASALGNASAATVNFLSSTARADVGPFNSGLFCRRNEAGDNHHDRAGRVYYPIQMWATIEDAIDRVERDQPEYDQHDHRTYRCKSQLQGPWPLCLLRSALHSAKSDEKQSSEDQDNGECCSRCLPVPSPAIGMILHDPCTTGAAKAILDLQDSHEKEDSKAASNNSPCLAFPMHRVWNLTAMSRSGKRDKRCGKGREASAQVAERRYERHWRKRTNLVHPALSQSQSVGSPARACSAIAAFSHLRNVNCAHLQHARHRRPGLLLAARQRHM